MKNYYYLLKIENVSQDILVESLWSTGDGKFKKNPTFEQIEHYQSQLRIIEDAESKYCLIPYSFNFSNLLVGKKAYTQDEIQVIVQDSKWLHSESVVPEKKYLEYNGIKYDIMNVDYVASDRERYTYSKDGVVQVVTDVTYTNSSKSDIISVGVV